MRVFISFLSLTLFFSCFIACNNAPQGEAATTSEATKTAESTATAQLYKLDTEGSVINWVGSKPNGEHTGTLNMKEGSVSVKDGKIESGKFLIDMNSISCTDLEGDKKASLEAHLKGTRSPEEKDDFFNVEEFPTASFKIAEVTALTGDANGMTHNIKGNLAMKGTTYSVTFPAKVEISETGVSAESADFTIDRTKWGITFMSPTALNLKEKFLNDNIGLRISLKAAL